MSELARRTGMTRQSMAELVDYLEAHGYVERVSDPSDRRAPLVRRTDRGWMVNRVARRVVEEAQGEWAHALGREEFDQLLGHLRRLAGVIGRPAGLAGHPEPEEMRDDRQGCPFRPDAPEVEAAMLDNIRVRFRAALQAQDGRGAMSAAAS